MFTFEDFQKAIRAYNSETRPSGTDEFSRLRKEGQFFSDIKSREDVENQVKIFAGIISEMQRDSFAPRYVVQSFLMDFCKYLEMDFLFNLTDHRTFLTMKKTMKGFTEEIQENDRKFRENIGSNSLDHLLEDYGILLKHSTIKTDTKKTGKKKAEGKKTVKKVSRTSRKAAGKKPLENEAAPISSLWNNDGKLW